MDIIHKYNWKCGCSIFFGQFSLLGGTVRRMKTISYTNNMENCSKFSPPKPGNWSFLSPSLWCLKKIKDQHPTFPPWVGYEFCLKDLSQGTRQQTPAVEIPPGYSSTTPQRAKHAHACCPSYGDGNTSR